MTDDKARGNDELGDEVERAEKSRHNLKQRLDKKFDGIGKNRAELDSMEKRLSELREQSAGLAKTQSQLKGEITSIEERIHAIDLESGRASICGRVIDNILQVWRRSKAAFFIQITLLAMIAATLAAAVISVTKHKDLILLLLEPLCFVIVLIIWIASPKYRLLCGIVMFSIAVAFAANWAPDQSTRWTLVSLVIALLAFGLGLQSFRSDETVEKRLDLIDHKLEKIIGRLDGADSVSKEGADQIEDKSE